MASDPRESLSLLYDQVTKCGKCGFCQPTCPVYRTTYREAHVARGKIALMRNVIEGETAVDADLRDAFDNCLLCRACTESCFSDLPTDRLVVEFRQAYASRFGRPMLQRFIFRTLLPHRRRMRTTVDLLWALRQAGLEGVASWLGLVDMINPKLGRALELREGLPGPFLRDRLKKAGAATSPPSERGEGGGLRVGYWISCGFEYMLPEVGQDAVAVLRAAGVSVEVLPNVCCGLPVYGYGDIDGAKALARRNVELVGDVGRFDAVVSDCASCSGHLKEYAGLLVDDAGSSAGASALAAKALSFSEFLAGAVEGGSSLRRGRSDLPASRPPVVVTYHEPCHLGARYQGVVRQPRDLLRSLPWVEFREMPGADACCGAAGSYNLMNPDASGAILQRKIENILATSAEIVATECPSCMLQLSLGLRRAGANVRVMGVSQLLAADEAEAGASRPG